jgi:8-amino-3,8-dideoxy-alpha-D-manno-octulosonate transaminase
MPGFEVFGKAEREQVNEVLETGILMRYGFDGPRAGRWKALELEEALQKELSVTHVQLTSSGTAALTVALSCMGVGVGDEVLCPTFTFVASFEAILSVGAIPILVDVDETLCMNAKAAEQQITKKTKVIMPVHMCGAMADLEGLKALCEKYNLYLLEDACQAIGGSYRGKPLGTHGDVGVFSFDFVKTITCGEGGALVTHQQKIKIKADAFHDHGHDHLGKNRGLDRPLFLGLNFRISELHAAVGLAQLSKLKSIVNQQRKNKKILKNALKKIPGLSFRKILDPKGDNAGFLTLIFPDRITAQRAFEVMNKTGLDNCFYWFEHRWHYLRSWEHLFELKSLNLLPKPTYEKWKEENKRDFSSSDSIMERTLSVLIKINWSPQEVESMAQTLKLIITKSLENVKIQKHSPTP